MAGTDSTMIGVIALTIPSARIPSNMISSDFFPGRIFSDASAGNPTAISNKHTNAENHQIISGSDREWSVV